MQTKCKHASTCQRALLCKYISVNKCGRNVVKHFQSRHFDPQCTFPLKKKKKVIHLPRSFKWSEIMNPKNYNYKTLRNFLIAPSSSDQQS